MFRRTSLEWYSNHGRFCIQFYWLFRWLLCKSISTQITTYLSHIYWIAKLPVGPSKVLILFPSFQVIRNDTTDGVYYFRGCSDLGCDNYKSEFCSTYGEGAEAVTVSRTSMTPLKSLFPMP